MMNLQTITSKLTKYLRAFRYGDYIRPLRDWLVIVSIAGILLMVSAVWSFAVYFEVSREKENKGGPKLMQPNIATAATVRAIFEKRASERTHYLSDYHFVDPSH